jgi:hypothetical protein
MNMRERGGEGRVRERWDRERHGERVCEREGGRERKKNMDSLIIPLTG